MTESTENSNRVPSYVWQKRPLPALWTIGSVLSIVLNLILLVVVVILARNLFAIKALVQDQLLGGLYYNFILMDDADIVTTVVVDDTIPVQFDLEVKTNTTVVLTEDVLLEGATVKSLRSGGLTILNAPAEIILPAGTRLPIFLDIVVPVDTTIPVVLNVPVTIPLDETDLHEPFSGLQEVVAPYYDLLNALPNSWEEVWNPDK